MSGMMEGNIKYTEDYRNEILSGWLNVDTSSMPPIYTMSNQVYLIRLKDNTYAAIRFLRNQADIENRSRYILLCLWHWYSW